MTDRVRAAFLQAQLEAGLALSASSDILELTPLEGSPPARYIADFRCRSFAHDGRTVVPIDRVIIGIHLTENYLFTFQPERVITVLAPHQIWHPNIRGSLLCPGAMPAGTPLVELLQQIYEVIAGYRVTLDERFALNPEVCAWSRQNRHLYPIDRRPLRRRPEVEAGAVQEAVR